MRVAALVKQVPAKAGEGFEMDALSRRAVAQAVELAAAVGDGECTAISVGRSRAEGDELVREAIAWGTSCNVMTDGVVVADPELDALDPIPTARVLAATLERDGPFQLVLVGDRSSEEGSGQTGAAVAELLDLPFVGPARFLSMKRDVLHVRCERGDAFVQATVTLPAVVSCAEQLIPPCEVPAPGRAAVPSERIRVLDVRALGAVAAGHDAPPADPSGPGAVGIVAEPGDLELSRSLVRAGAAQRSERAWVAAICAGPDDAAALASAGVDEAVVLSGAIVAEDVARAAARWATDHRPCTLVTSGSAWGREIAGRVRARQPDGVKILVAPRSPPAPASSAPARDARVTTLAIQPRGRVRVRSRTRRS